MTPIKAVRFLNQVQFGGRVMTDINTERIEHKGVDIALTRVEGAAAVQCSFDDKVRLVPLCLVAEWTPMDKEEK